jgi:hypothetical protein
MTNPIAEIYTVWWTPPGETESVRARENNVN